MSEDAAVDAAVWQRIADAGIRVLRIPTPFQVGRVNTYLLEDDPLTLVDSGPNSGKALDELERQLGALGHGIEDLELVIVTHQHIDHLGLVDIVANRSGAEVAAIDVAVPFLENFGDDAERDDEEAAALMRAPRDLRGGGQGAAPGDRQLPGLGVQDQGDQAAARR